MLERPGRFVVDPLVLVALFLVEGSSIALFLCLLKKADKPTADYLRSAAGRALIVFMVVLIAAAVVVLVRYRSGRRSDRASFWMTIAMNLVTAVAVLSCGEIAIRLFVERTYEGLRFAGTLLLPRDWDVVAESNLGLVDRASRKGAWVASFLVFDDLLGWVNGPDRAGSDGLTYSSTEGIRGWEPGLTLGDLAPKRNIAIFGDSYTFSLDVRYTDSWGYWMERELGSEFRVLNFGVDGYGLDQAYLRYRRDGRRWDPEVVILGLIEHDLHRTMVVYPFLSFPPWHFPFAKPRMVVDDEELRLINYPVPSPEAIFSRPSIRSLPFLEYDPGYYAAQWELHFYDRSQLIRFLISRFPPWPPVRSLTSNEALVAINGEILNEFLRLARSEGSQPIVVYFPSRAGDFSTQESRRATLARSVFTSAHVDVVDLTSCVSTVPADQRFEPGKFHYSGASNRAVARCLTDVLRPLLEGGGVRDAARRVPADRREDRATLPH